MPGLRHLAVVLALLLIGGAQGLLADAALAGPCDPPFNEIVCENSKAGSPPSVWDVNGAGASNIQGFSTNISVNQGGTIGFKIDTPSTDYRLDIYRMGYYAGNGARKVATVQPSVSLPQNQPTCAKEPSTGLVDCGNWTISASWTVPSTAVSGIYFAKLEREDASSEGSHIVFIVRDDDGESELLFQTSDTTWQAYNQYGGNSLYVGGPGTNPGRAYKVSYNRPLTTRQTTSEDSPFNAEYPMVRWLERNGYDVSYTSGVDTARSGGELLDHDIFLSVGHDEYWSAEQRDNVEAARDAGVNLAFFSGNEIFWKTRWEPSIDGSGTNHRTLVCYKETHFNGNLDPDPDTWTGTWRDSRFSPPADGGEVENALSGTAFMVNAGTTEIKVPAEDGELRLWRDTDVAELGTGQTATLAEDTLGYEWDEDLDNGFRPEGLVRLSSTTTSVPQKLQDYGNTYASGTATHHMTLYRADSGALVFGAGTVQWPWGLDSVHDRGSGPVDPNMQQATINLFADMGVQPEALQAGLVAATQTSDDVAPQTTIVSPPEGAEVEVGQTVTINGTATDSEGEGGPSGEVGAVEVSVDGGESWRPATGRDSWSFSWTPNDLGEATVFARAADDSGNLEDPGHELTVEVAEASCPCTIWDEGVTGGQDNDSKAVELGTKFRADANGYITGVRYYRTSGNAGPHSGRLWTKTGTQLAQVTFNGESASGWQQANFDTPVAITAGTTYVVSYHAPAGKYASIKNYFQVVGVDNPPLHALANNVDGPNGIYEYGPAGGLFADGSPSTFQSESYLVDVVFEESIAPDTTPPVINGRTPPPGATEVSTATTVTASFNEAMNPATIDGSRVELRDPSNNLIPATVSYNVAERRLTLDPTPTLQLNTIYTAKVKGGAGGVTDVAGNALAATSTWSFTTVPPPPPPPDEGPGGPILVIANEANPFSRYYGEILRAEGLNQFTVTDISKVTPAVLAARDVAILGEGALTPAQATTLSDWVQAGGNLIAMRPDGDLTSLLGITPIGGSLANAYLGVDTGSSPGAGIVADTIQFHGSADRYVLNGADAVATLYSNASSATSNPAVTLRSVGSNGGQAAAFTYDLARSVVYTRQGNPAWAGQERDAMSPIRSDDLFFGNKAGDAQADWVDLSKVAIPQADEQQRLLSNLIGEMNLDRKPLPRFWFLPRDEKAAVVMTGDDHAQGGTAGRLDAYKALDPPGCDVDDWECVRSTSYLIPNNPLLPAKAASLVADGFEIAVHTSTGCEDWTDEAELLDDFEDQFETFEANYPSLPPPTTNRLHCIVWSDWASQAKVSVKTGIRFDTNYYYWPGAWVANRPGMFTGSGVPMRFADLDGSLIDVYQATTQMTDESGQTYPFTSDALLDRALGPEQYFGVFTANMHTDDVESPNSDAIVASAMARDVPIVSARQMLTWIDGRNQSSFGSVAWADDELSFTISPGAGANGLRAMVPVESDSGPLEEVARNGTPVATTTRTIKGVEYAFFDAAAGNYTATYLSGSLPFITDLQATAANNGTATITWETNKPASSRVDYGTNPESLGSNKTSAALVTSHSLQLTGLNPNTTYHFRATSTDSEAKSVVKPNPPLAPQSFLTPPAAPTLSGTSPASPSNVNTPQVLGSAAAGSTVRVYSTSDCSGSPLATGTAVTLAAGIEVTVAENATTALRATAATTGGVSACSAAISYVEDSVAPAVQIDTGPTGLTKSSTPTFTFSSEPGVTFACSIDTGTANFAPCSGSGTHTPASPLGDGAKTFRVRATDAAGNQAIATRAFSVDATPPDTTIGTKPSTPTNSTTADFTFGGSDDSGSGVASFECRHNSGSFSPCTTPLKLTGLSPGAHSLEVRAVDVATNVDPTPVVHAWTIDTTAPTVTVDSLSKALVKAGETSNLTWHANENGNFQLRVGGADCDTGTAIDSGAYSTQPNTRVSAVAAAALAEGANTLRLCLTDAAGNRGSVTQAISKDTGLPDTSIGTKPNALTASTTADFTFTGSDTGGSGVASFECKLDSASFSPCTSPLNLTSLGQGSHKLEVRAIDNAGNVDGSPASHEWTVDSVGPEATITDEPPAISASALASFSFTGSDPGGSGVESFECRRDSQAPGDWQPCKAPLNYNSLAEGLHTFEVRAIDKAGNVDPTPPSYEWRVDTVAPDTTIGALKPSSPTNSTEAELGFSGSDTGGSGVASFECKLDSGTFGPCTSPRKYTSLGQGPHSFEVRAIDQAGNVDTSPAIHTWTIDTTAPTVTADSLSDALLKAGETSNLTWHANENGSFQLRVGGADCDTGAVIDSGAYSTQPNTRVSAIAAAQLAEGANTLRLCLTDAAGNRGQAPTTIGKDTGLPDTTIGALKPPALTNSTEAEFGFTGSDAGGSGVASFECKLDSGAFEPCSAPRKYTSLGQGSHSFEVRAIDQAGNTDGSPAVHTWTVDTTAPTVTADSLSDALVKAGETSNLTWHANENGSFQLRVGGADCDTGAVIDSGAYSTQPNTRVSAIAAAQLAEGANTLRLCLTDAAGNRGQATSAIVKDTGLPDTTIGALKPPALTNSTEAEFGFTGSDPGGSGVASFECKLDSGAFESCATPRKYTGLGQGSHKLEVRAIDQAGNTDASPASYEWVVDSVAPGTEITANPAPFVNSSTANFSFTGTDPGGSGIGLFQCRRDSEEAADWQPCTAPLKYLSLADGPHSFQVRAIDKAGNADPDPATVTWTIDTVAPSTQITTKPPAVTNATTADLGFTGSDPSGSGVASFECKLDDGAFESCTTPRQYTDLDEGSHTFEVRAIDKAGNVDGEAASHAWVIDLTPPVVQIDSGPSGLTKDSTPTFTFSSEPGASFACSVDTGTPSFAPCSGAGAHTPASPLADGPYTFRVRATDGSTNQAVATRSFAVDTATPDPPELSHTVPASPANHNNPKVFGSALDGTTVRLFAGATCAGAPLATVPTAALAAGIEVTVSGDTSTSFSATATSTSGNDSDCSAALTYLEDSTAPDTTIGSKPPTPTNSAAASFSFSGEDGAGSGVASFQCRLNSGAFGACDSPQVYSGLEEGSHTFQVRAIDAAGNLDGEPAAHTWLVDLTPPAVQVDFGPAGFTANQTPTFSFSSEPGASFQCSVDTGTPSFAPCSGTGTHTPAAPLADGPKTFRVRASDAAGNQAVATRGFTVDATAPQTQITAQPTALTNVANASFSFTGSDPGGSGVASFECRLDDGAWGGCNTPHQYTGLEQGSHTFQVRAIDQADNPDSDPASHAWEIDLTPPAVQVDSGPDGVTNDSTPTFSFSSEPGSSFQCSVDTGTPSFAPCSGAGAHTPAAPLPDGPRTFRVRATDSATNQAVATRGFTVDATAPDTSIGLQPNTPTNSTEAEFGFTGADPGGSGIGGFECKLDSGAFEPCPSPRKYTGLAPGSHKFEVRAIDLAGNVDGSPAIHIWAIDTTPPSVQVDSGPDGFTANQAPTFSFSSEPGVGFACSVDTGTPSFAPCSGVGAHTPTSPLSDGPKTFRVRATDAAGNQAVATRGFTVDATAPDTAIGALKPPTPTNSTEAEFGFTGSDTGGSGVASFACKLDSGAFEPCATPRKYTPLGQGSHSFEVRAIDQVGNVDGSPAIHTWTVDTTAPTVTVDSLSDALVKAGESSDLTWHANQNGNFQLRVGGADCDAGTVIDSGAYSTQPNTRVSTVNASALAEGANTLRLCLTDTAGNRGQATTTLSKDTGFPDTAIGALKPPALTNATTAEFGFTGSDTGGSGVAGFECKLDSGTFEPCTTPRKYTGLAPGSHSFEVRAIDLAGNADASPATHTWSVDTTPPSVQIDGGPNGLTNDSTPTFSFSSEPGASFECSVDTGTPEFGPCSAAGTHTPASPLTDGPKTFRVRATDVAGNQAVATRGFQVDTATPLTPELSATEPASPADHNAPKIIGSAPAGATIRLYRGPECADLPLATVPTAALEAGIEVSVDDDSTSLFSATATSAAGNLSPCSESISYVEDSTPPETEITAQPPLLSDGDEASFSFEGSDAGSGVASFECKLDDGAFAPCETGIELTGLDDGSHGFQVRAIDQAGTSDPEPASHTWTVDTTAPTVTPDSLSDALVKAGETSNLTWHANENGSFQLRVGGADCDTGTVIDSGAYSTQPNTRVSAVAAAQLAEGANTLRLCLTDAAGNRGQATSTISKDTGLPDTTIGVLKPPALTNSTEAEFGFTGSDTSGSGVASFECKLDSGAFEPCATPRKYTGLAPGSHSFEVRAIDLAGNADASPATHTWSVDTTPPSVSIDGGPNGLTNDSTPTFSFSSEPGASFECSIDTGTPSFAPCSGVGTHTPASPLTDGPKTFRVRATDVAGNQAVATRGFQVDTAAPAPPELTATVPASPANDNSPLISGTAAAGTTVRLYEGAECLGSPLATLTAAELAAGTEVNVGDDTVTQFSATATTAAQNTSGCSEPLSYREDSAAPDSAIGAKPTTPTNSTEAEFTFTGSDTGGSGVAGFECKLDSGAFEPCTTPREYTGLAPGSHSFEVRAIDLAGNADASPATHTWSVDTTPPSVQIDGGPNGLTNDSTPTFSFSSEPGTSFECSVDTGTPSFAPCSGTGTHTPASPLSDGPHTFRVRATDGAQNQAVVTSGFNLDSTPPETEITAQPPLLSNSGEASFSFAGSDTGSGVASFECKLDDGAFAPCESGLELTGLGQGEHSFEVRAVDQAGNRDPDPAAHEWTIDTVAPETEVESGPEPISASADAEFSFQGTDAGSGVASLQCRRDSEEWAPCGSPRSYSSLAEGSHQFEVRATDGAGNTDPTPATYEWTIDTQAPSTVIDLHPAAISGSAVARFEFFGEDGSGTGVASFECKLDVGAFAPCESGLELTGLGQGEHSFEVRAVDQAGNTDPTPAAYEWTVDAAAPETAIESQPPAQSASAEASFAFSGEDGEGSGVDGFQCRLDSTESGEWQLCDSPREYTSLSQGGHKFEVRAVDHAGNADAEPASYSWTIDLTAPNVVVNSGPNGPTNDSTPTFSFSSEPGASFACSVDTGTPEFGPCSGTGTHTPGEPLSEGPYTFRVRAADLAGNAATASRAFTIDLSVPDAPQLSATNPASPANDNSPLVTGSAPAGTTVRIYGNAECTGTPLGSGTGVELGSGIAVSVADDTTTTLSATATTVAGNASSCSEPLSYREDSTAAETTIGAKPGTPISSTEAEFGFTGADPGGSGVASFECKLDDGSFEPCTDPRGYASLSDGSHTFEVRAIDLAGNADASPATHTWTIDTTPPNVSIDGGPNGLTNDSTPTFSFSSEPGASFECSVDTGAASFAPCSGTGTHTPASPLSDGPHTFRVRATDGAQNQAAATRAFQVDTVGPEAPALTATDPASPANENNPVITGSAPAGTTVRLYAAAGCAGAPLATATAAELATGIEVAVADDTTTSFSATARTAAENVSPCSQPLEYREDSSGPSTEIGSRPSAISSVTDANFTFQGADGTGSGVASFECRLDSSAPEEWAPCSSPQQYTDLAEGPHSFAVRAIDNAGNPDPTPAAVIWTVDTDGPPGGGDDGGGGSTDTPTPDGDPPPATATAKYLRVVRDLKTGKAQVIFDVTGPGLLSARSAEIAQTSKRLRADSGAARAARTRQLRLRQRSIKPASVRVTGPGEVALPIELTAAGKKALKASQALKVKVLIRFETAAGAPATWKLTVTLKKRPASVTKSTRPRGPAAS